MECRRQLYNWYGLAVIRTYMVGMEASFNSTVQVWIALDTGTASERAKAIKSEWLNDLYKSAVYIGFEHKDTQSN